jgi:CubicO group peptidase (beta-lactamase class C family)
VLAAEIRLADGRVVSSENAGLVVPWWSFTKTVIAAAALMLVRDGYLTLDAEIERRGYTLRQLLQHTAGLTDYGALPSYHEAVARNEEPWPAAEMLQRTEAGRFRYEPGQGWGYSNIGYLAVRRLVEKWGKGDLCAVLDRLVMRPLGIKGVRLAASRADLADVEMGAARGYHPDWVYHGLLFGPLEQAAFLLDGLLKPDFLPERLRAAMLTAVPVGHEPGNRPWQKPAYGLGLMCEGSNADGPAGHTGGGPGSVIAVYRRTDRGAVETAAAFALGQDEAAVERAAFGLWSSARH